MSCKGANRAASAEGARLHAERAHTRRPKGGAPCAEGTLFQHRGRARHQSGTVNKHTHYRGNEQHRGAALEQRR